MDYDLLPKGVDVSHWNGAVDWGALASAGIQFCYLKATQGMGVDPAFDANRKGAAAAGILWMPYPFLTAEDDDAVVRHFNDVVGAECGPAVLDWEVQGISSSVVETWIGGLGRIPLAYYGLYPPDDVTPLIAECPRILPEYAPAPRLPAWDGTSTPDWSKEWLIWQRSEKATFQGTAGNFDLDVLAVPFDRFQTWCKTGLWTAPAA